MLLKNLEIRDFRGFPRFRIPQLGRVNLLVGTNNCGKTSILEAVEILTSIGDFSPIWHALRRRGEEIRSDAGPPPPADSNPEVDVRRLFRGHTLGVGSRFLLSAGSDRGESTLEAVVEDAVVEPPPSIRAHAHPAIEAFPRHLSLSLNWKGLVPRDMKLPLGYRGGVPVGALFTYAPTSQDEGRPIRFVTAMSLAAKDAVSLFDQVVLTPQEDMVLDAMRLIDPRIDRIAVSSAEISPFSKGVGSKGGILVRLKGFDDRVPIGSMGDGIWRMFGLALSTVQATGGVLLVDEIDTGLHYTVMRDMWRFLYQCAKKYDVQVVATTHSWDCCRALAAICREDVSEGSDVVISRIERGREEAVSYSEQEIIAVAERDIEVR